MGTNWEAWAGLSDITSASGIHYKNIYEVTTLYARILPSEFSLKIPMSNTPQIYKLIIVNHQHIIYAELQTNAHNLIPINIGQPLEDGLEYQTKSLAQNAAPFQDVTTSYMTSIIDSRRRAISDRTLYDPQRISSVHINSANPSAKIPVRPTAQGTPIQNSVYAFPYREDQAANSMQQIQMLLGFSNQLSGQNQASQGQFVKGNKTLHEFESVMQNANGRDQLVSLILEDQVFTPMKFILKMNNLQYQGSTKLYNEQQRKEIEIDPVAMRNAVMQFTVTDGLIPASKVINSDSFSTAMQVMGSSPEIAGAYNLGPAFSYFMKTQGAEIEEFEKSQEQIAYEQALGAWQQMMQFAIEKGMEPEAAQQQLPPQPLPEQFGYDPGNNTPSPEGDKTDTPTQNQSGTIPGA